MVRILTEWSSVPPTPELERQDEVAEVKGEKTTQESSTEIDKPTGSDATSSAAAASKKSELAMAGQAQAAAVQNAVMRTGDSADPSSGLRQRALEIAANDDGAVKISNGISSGQDRVTQMARDTVIPPPKSVGTDDPKGKLILDGQKKNWCGIYATDVWRQAGVPVHWNINRGAPVDADGKTVPSHPVTTAGKNAGEGVKPGDMIRINDVDSTKGTILPDDRNHHALVEAVVYKGPGKGDPLVAVPPASERPENSRVAGYVVRDGNDPRTSTDIQRRLGQVSNISADVPPSGEAMLSTHRDYYPLDGMENGIRRKVTSYMTPDDVHATSGKLR